MGSKSKNTLISRSLRKSSPVTFARSVSQDKKIQLLVRSGGRCEFAGCNKYVLEHHLTGTSGNFSQLAHMYAFSPGGPRANSQVPRARLNDVDNLMVLCHACHKLIDDHPHGYPVARLKRDKAAHETRIHHLTGIHSELKTVIVRMTARIAGRVPTISYAQMAEAVDPYYPESRTGITIDLSQLSTSGENLIDMAKKDIDQKLAGLASQNLDGMLPSHVSVFALAPIPLLMYLGRALSDKQQVALHQFHRDSNDWKWKTTGTDVAYAFAKHRTGSSPERVALCLSLSGHVDISSLPASIDADFTVYEITLASETHSPLFLRKQTDLDAFRKQYMIALRTIAASHPTLRDIHLFPAVPAPVAIVCGHVLLPKVDPTLLVYDADKANGGFTLALTVN